MFLLFLFLSFLLSAFIHFPSFYLFLFYIVLSHFFVFAANFTDFSFFFFCYFAIIYPGCLLPFSHSDSILSLSLLLDIYLSFFFFSYDCFSQTSLSPSSYLLYWTISNAYTSNTFSNNFSSVVFSHLSLLYSHAFIHSVVCLLRKWLLCISPLN